ncbi:MAG: hypothetical protein R2764_16170 [Bacteroidales bacterium]
MTINQTPGIQTGFFCMRDGSIGATWTRGMEDPSFDDRGTGYNYFDGNAWGDWQEWRIENLKTHRPTYSPYGENGEMVVSHISFTGLYLATREDKGSGAWDFETFPGPAGNSYILWNRAVSSGPDRNRIHMLALTLPSSHGGIPYQNLDAALLYSYSTDGGVSWYWENEILQGMTADDYNGFKGDSYNFAEPKDDIVAFVVGSNWYDLFLMKSTDGGETFEKTVIWEHPYPLWQFGTATDTFYCADGSNHLAIDNSGNVHVAFGITRVMADNDATFLFPFVDGIAYWNESMPTFSNNLNALSPYGETGSELSEDYNLIGWSQDLNNNGTIDIVDMGDYWISLSSMPQLVIDDDNKLFLIYSSATESYDNGSKNYRHIWGRYSLNGQSWGPFVDLTNDLIQLFDECVYPSCSPTSDENIYLVYQSDIEPGTIVWGAQHSYLDNKAVFMKVPKSDFWTTGVDSGNELVNDISVSQNYPNPCTGKTEIRVSLNNAYEINIEITTLTGKIVYQNTMQANPGENRVKLETSKVFSRSLLLYGKFRRFKRHEKDDCGIITFNSFVYFDLLGFFQPNRSYSFCTHLNFSYFYRYKTSCP